MMEYATFPGQVGKRNNEKSTGERKDSGVHRLTIVKRSKIWASANLEQAVMDEMVSRDDRRIKIF